MLRVLLCFSVVAPMANLSIADWVMGAAVTGALVLGLFMVLVRVLYKQGHVAECKSPSCRTGTDTQACNQRKCEAHLELLNSQLLPYYATCFVGKMCSPTCSTWGASP